MILTTEKEKSISVEIQMNESENRKPQNKNQIWKRRTIMTTIYESLKTIIKQKFETIFFHLKPWNATQQQCQ